MSICVEALCSPSSIHASLSACFIARPALSYGACCKGRLGHTTRCQIVERSEWARVRYTDCIDLYWRGNRAVNSRQLDFILIFTTCLMWPLTMCLASSSLGSAIFNTRGFSDSWQKSYSSVPFLSNTPTFLNGEQNHTTVHTDIAFLIFPFSLGMKLSFLSIAVNYATMFLEL